MRLVIVLGAALALLASPLAASGDTPSGYLRICNYPGDLFGSPDPDVAGSFRYTITPPAGSSISEDVPIDGCSDQPVAAGVAHVAQQPRTDYSLQSVTLDEGGPLGAVDLANQTVDVTVPAPTDPSGTSISFYNGRLRAPLKICHALTPATVSMAAARRFDFDVTTPSGTQLLSIIDPGSPIGACKIVPAPPAPTAEFLLGTQITVSEHAQTDLCVKSVNTPNADLTTRTATVTIVAGINQAAFLDAAAPCPPATVVAAAGDASALVTWTPRNDDGAVTSYTVAASPPDVPPTTVPVSQTSTTITGLTNGQPYTFTVTASTASSSGEGSAPSNPVTPLQDATAPIATIITAPAGGTVESGPAVPDASAPVGTAVTTPTGGTVAVATSAVDGVAPTGYDFAGKAAVVITAPPATVEAPLRLTFVLDKSLIPTGGDAYSIDIFRDGGAPIQKCSDSSDGTADPDPCWEYPRETTTDGDVSVTIRTSHASTWNFGVHKSTDFSLGPAAMQGDLKLDPGAPLQVGYDLRIPGKHPATTVHLVHASVSFHWTCSEGTGSGTLTIPIDDVTYADPADSPSWYPRVDIKDPATFQARGAVPTGICPGAKVRLNEGGTFTGGVWTDDVDHRSVSVRWHYTATDRGGWSTAAAVVPA